MKWFATIDFGQSGCGTHMLIEADTQEKANELAREHTIDWASSYGFEQDPDYFGEYDSVGRNWDEYEQEYEDIGFIDCDAEPYDPEEHDGYL